MTADPYGPEPIGPALRRRRQAAQLSLAALARQVHYSKGYLSKVETGQARGTLQLAVLCDVVLDTGGELAACMEWDDRPADGPGPRARADPSSLMIQCGIDLLIAMDLAHNRLRHLARADADAEHRGAESLRSMQDSGLYSARERLLVSGSAALVTAGEFVFRRLVHIRNEVRNGADLDSTEYHRVYHAFAAALWAYRMTIRAELGQPAITPAQLDLIDWSDRDSCPACR
ncbi:helix-turn-helix domain-containing protein [Micromonospora sp. RP3T]|uniref:helix-turn-helix domain-containing protein n=1 Tax=Micromonospora sp. RP3T TaxID=2135446 RepID=UPI000D16563F|nr:helix-turn-helix domain-containing protein [Micromonospora sp. RP3T]PTA43217.1 hypothetical protein C8054_26480 [Micromonospora sp. RP3T]